METLAELKERRALVYEAYKAAAKSQSYKVGQGGAGRELARGSFESLRQELAAIDALIAKHPEAIALLPSWRRRRVRYIGPQF